MKIGTIFGNVGTDATATVGVILNGAKGPFIKFENRNLAAFLNKGADGVTIPSLTAKGVLFLAVKLEQGAQLAPGIIKITRGTYEVNGETKYATDTFGYINVSKKDPQKVYISAYPSVDISGDITANIYALEAQAQAPAEAAPAPAGYGQPQQPQQAPAPTGYGQPQQAPAPTGYGQPQQAPAPTGYGQPQAAPTPAGYGQPQAAPTPAGYGQPQAPAPDSGQVPMYGE